MRRWAMLLFTCLLSQVGNGIAETFKVEHDHFWRSCKGSLVFNDASVDYIADKKEHSRSWKYEDIQQLALAPDRITILSYNARIKELGGDQPFNFKLIEGTPTEQLRSHIAKKLTRPLVSSIIPEKTEVRFSIPARHKLFLNDSQGILEFAEEILVYRAGEPGQSRIWRYDELLSIGSTGPFQLRIGAIQKTGGEYGDEKNYLFDLKRRMTSEEYDFIWGKINRRQGQ